MFSVTPLYILLLFTYLLRQGSTDLVAAHLWAGLVAKTGVEKAGDAGWAQ